MTLRDNSGSIWWDTLIYNTLECYGLNLTYSNLTSPKLWLSPLGATLAPIQSGFQSHSRHVIKEQVGVVPSSILWSRSIRVRPRSLFRGRCLGPLVQMCPTVCQGSLHSHWALSAMLHFLSHLPLGRLLCWSNAQAMLKWSIADRHHPNLALLSDTAPSRPTNPAPLSAPEAPITMPSYSNPALMPEWQTVS